MSHDGNGTIRGVKATEYDFDFPCLQHCFLFSLRFYIFLFFSLFLDYVPLLLLLGRLILHQIPRFTPPN